MSDNTAQPLEVRSSDQLGGWTHEHDLKVWPAYFEALILGNKTFELRRNDRDFKVGDVLRLREWTEPSGYTGRETRRRVTYVMHGGDFGLHEDYACLGISAA